jgi:hypothetical protein
MDELLVYKDADGALGDLARELISITENYKAGELSLAEKNELVAEVIKIYAAHETADKEIIARWSVTVATNLISIV